MYPYFSSLSEFNYNRGDNMSNDIEADLIGKSDQVIQEDDLAELVKHLHRIINNFLEAKNLNDSQKGQIESIRFIFGSILSKVVFHTILEEEEFSANLEKDNIQKNKRGLKMAEITEVRYLTDDRDSNKRNELVITLGGNGDWYVAVVPEGEGAIGRGVRICTSGGASTIAPGLAPAIALAFRSLLNAKGEGITHIT